MSRFKRVGGRYGMHSGSGRFKNLEVDQSMFFQGSTLGQFCQGTIYYVDKNISNSGDGKSWDSAFKTITLGFAALSNYDWLIIGPGNYDEAATITLTGKKGCKIFGYNTGMQWGEGTTCWRDVTSTDDLLNLTGCQSIEISGIGFINTAAKDAINFTGLCYSVHIHDCSFVADTGGGATALYGINAGGANGPDLYVHDCRFFRYVTAAIVMGHQRNVIQNNFIVVPAAGHGINYASGTAPYNLVADNYFLGANSTDIGISGTAGSAGNEMITHNWFANLSSEIETSVDENCLENYYADATTGGGVVAVCDPEA